MTYPKRTREEHADSAKSLVANGQTGVRFHLPAIPSFRDDIKNGRNPHVARGVEHTVCNRICSATEVRIPSMTKLFIVNPRTYVRVRAG